MIQQVMGYNKGTFFPLIAVGNGKRATERLSFLRQGFQLHWALVH